jgi:ATP-dependent protease ClpP protease subunit
MNGWYEIRNEASTPSVAEIDIFDTIGWEVDATTFIQDLRAIDATEIRLNVNSPGGSVFDGLAILNALRQHPARITSNVLGVAASAASFIVVGASDHVSMAANSTMMIHSASGIVLGNAEDMKQAADWLNLIDKNLAAIYASKAGGTVADWLDLMHAETWYLAEDAVKAGLADSVDASHQAPSAPAAKASPKNSAAVTLADVQTALTLSGDLARTSAHHLPAAPEPGLQETHQEEDSMSALSDGLRQRLGITDAALDEDGLLTALDEATLAQLTADAAAGRAARDAQITADRESAINAAVTSGRIAPARAQHWRDQLIADPGAVEVLNSLAPVVPVEPSGHTGGADDSTDDDAFYDSLFAGKQA